MPVSNCIDFIHLFRLDETLGSSNYSGWFGLLPATEDDIIQNETRLGITIPQSYRDFARVHNGFLHNGWGSLGLKPLHTLYFVRNVDKSNYLDHGFDFGRILAICGDGAGNEQCYDLDQPLDKDDRLTFDWDHETRRLTKPQPFWAFLEKFIKREM